MSFDIELQPKAFGNYKLCYLQTPSFFQIDLCFFFFLISHFSALACTHFRHYSTISHLYLLSSVLLPTKVMIKLHPSLAPAGHQARSHKQTQTCDRGGEPEKQQQKVLLSRQNAWTAQRLTAPGPSDEVRNQINKGGSWHRWSPLARACCFDDRQDELMRYDVLCGTVSPSCTVVSVTTPFLISPRTHHLYPLHWSLDKQQYMCSMHVLEKGTWGSCAVLIHIYSVLFETIINLLDPLTMMH